MFVGCGGTAPSPSSELLDVATAMPSSLLLGSGAVARATRATLPMQSIPKYRCPHVSFSKYDSRTDHEARRRLPRFGRDGRAPFRAHLTPPAPVGRSAT